MPSGKVHFAAGVVASAVVLTHYNQDPRLMLLGGVAALLPDIDHPRAMLGKYNPMSFLFKHRGFTHSYVAMLLLVLGAWLYTKNPGIALTIGIGYVSHIWLDYLTPAGVPLWWPSRNRKSIRRIFKRKR